MTMEMLAELPFKPASFVPRFIVDSFVRSFCFVKINQTASEKESMANYKIACLRN